MWKFEIKSANKNNYSSGFIFKTKKLAEDGAGAIKDSYKQPVKVTYKKAEVPA